MRRSWQRNEAAVSRGMDERASYLFTLTRILPKSVSTAQTVFSMSGWEPQPRVTSAEPMTPGALERAPRCRRLTRFTPHISSLNTRVLCRVPEPAPCLPIPSLSALILPLSVFSVGSVNASWRSLSILSSLFPFLPTSHAAVTCLTFLHMDLHYQIGLSLARMSAIISPSPSRAGLRSTPSDRAPAGRWRLLACSADPQAGPGGGRY